MIQSLSAPHAAPADTDQQLIERTLSGSADAFGGLVCRYRDRLLHDVQRLIPSFLDAEDVVQEALVKAFLQLRKFRQESAFFTWLFRIALNHSRSLGRRLKAKTSLARCRGMEHINPRDPQQPSLDEMIRRESQTELRLALTALNGEHRRVLELRELDGLDYAAIAEKLELKVGTVRSRLNRARLQLRNQLAPSLS